MADDSEHLSEIDEEDEPISANVVYKTEAIKLISYKVEQKILAQDEFKDIEESDPDNEKHSGAENEEEAQSDQGDARPRKSQKKNVSFYYLICRERAQITSGCKWAF